MKNWKIFFGVIALSSLLGSWVFAEPSTPSIDKEMKAFEPVAKYFQQWTDLLKGCQREIAPLLAGIKEAKDTQTIKPLADRAKTIIRHYKEREQSLSFSIPAECQKIHTLTMEFYDVMLSYLDAAVTVGNDKSTLAWLDKANTLQYKISEAIFPYKEKLKSFKIYL